MESKNVLFILTSQHLCLSVGICQLIPVNICQWCGGAGGAFNFQIVSIVGSLRDREVTCSASDRQGSNFESCVWRAVSSQSSHHPQEVLLAQFSLYVHKGGLKPDSFHFISFQFPNISWSFKIVLGLYNSFCCSYRARKCIKVTRIVLVWTLSVHQASFCGLVNWTSVIISTLALSWDLYLCWSNVCDADPALARLLMLIFVITGTCLWSPWSTRFLNIPTQIWQSGIFLGIASERHGWKFK